MRRYWMPFHVGDYLADTSHLSTVEHGAYILLILHYWVNESIPETPRKRSKIARLNLKQWLAIEPTVQEFFHDGWHHKRIDQEIEKANKLSDVRSAAARKSHIRLVPK